MDMLVVGVLDGLIGGVILWLAAKMTSVDLLLRETVIAAGVAAVVSLIPAVGWVLSIVVLLMLLKKFSEADIWPDIVSRLVSFVALLAVGGV